MKTFANTIRRRSASIVGMSQLRNHLIQESSAKSSWSNRRRYVL